MRRAAFAFGVGLAAVLLLTAVPSPGRAHGWHGHHHYGHHWSGHRHFATRVDIGFGPAFWWGPPPLWYPPRTVHVYPPRVIVEEPPVYISRNPAPAPPAPCWYYCPSRAAYYPSVPTCPEPWVRVPPRTD
jgi:hypothetical protein